MVTHSDYCDGHHTERQQCNRALAPPLSTSRVERTAPHQPPPDHGPATGPAVSHDAVLNSEALHELYGYTEFTWAVYGRLVSQLARGRLTAPVTGSGWPSLAAAFRHLLRAYDTWLHERLGAGPIVVAHGEDVATWEAFAEWREKVRGTVRRLLASDADEAVTVRRLLASDADEAVTEDGSWRRSMSKNDVLAHVLLHERGHHGDISTLFSAMGVEMPSMDYGVYLYFKRRAQS
jgi:uncharacterized damage-inducible protein DinB